MVEKKVNISISIFVQPSMLEVQNAFQTMRNMNAIPEQDVYGTYIYIACMGMDLMLAFLRDGCLNPFSGGSYLAYKSYGTLSPQHELSIKNLIDNAIQVFDNEPMQDKQIMTPIDDESLQHLISLKKSSLLNYLQQKNVVKKDQNPGDEIFYRIGASIIGQFVDDAQKNGANFNRPIELSWGNNLGQKFRGVQLNRGHLQEFNPTVRRLLGF